MTSVAETVIFQSAPKPDTAPEAEVLAKNSGILSEPDETETENDKLNELHRKLELIRAHSQAPRICD